MANKNTVKKKITASAAPSSVIGTFEGTSADSMVTNFNGMDIGPEVWEIVFNSEDYDGTYPRG